MPKKRVLIVEDEWLLASALEVELAAADFEPVGPASTVKAAYEHVERGEIDAAILDASLGGAAVDGVAASLQERHIPFMFLTGKPRSSLPEAFRDVLLVEKPALESEVVEALRQLLT